MEEERIEAIRDWLELQSVRDIQVFLGFTNFYRRFIRNFSRIPAPPTSMLRTTNELIGNEIQSTSAKNQDAPSAAGRARSGGVDESFENLSTAAKSAKSKKSKSTKSKKSDLQKANFARVDSGTDFLTPKAKKAFIHLQKAFTEALIFRHFDPKHHIWIETDVSGHAIGEVFSQMTSDQYSSGHVTHEDPDSPKSEVG